MSVDVLMYQVKPLNENEFQEIVCMNVNDLDEIDGWQIRAYSFEEVSEHPTRFKQIQECMKAVELMHTTTDYKACCVAHGMPEHINSYGFCHHYGGGITVSFDGGYFQLTAADLDEFTTTQKKTYCVVKRKIIDVDVDSWIAKTLMKSLEECDDSENTDLSYAPIHLNAKSCEMICKALVGMYDSGEIFYPNAELGKFMLELMRAMYEPEYNVFIEFQD